MKEPSIGRARKVLALCEQPDRDRIVKGSIPTLIIDKHKVEGAERGAERESEAVMVFAIAYPW